MTKIKIYVIVLLMVLLPYQLVSAQDICETCIEDDPETCPPECTAPESPPPSYPYCGDGNCDQEEDCSSCSFDCGICEEETVPEECIESWSCSAWSDCNNGQQTRSCTDSRNCGTVNNKPDEIITCLEELEDNITETDNVSLEVNQTLSSLINISESEVIVNKSLQLFNGTEELENLVEIDDEYLQAKAEKTEVGKKRFGASDYLNKNALFFMLLVGFAAFIFVIALIFRKRRKKIKKIEIVEKIKARLIQSLGFNENLFNQLVAYINRNLDKGHDIETIKGKLIEAGHNMQVVKKMIEYTKKIYRK